MKSQSGREALRHLLDTDFAVILLDVHMPEMDGFETARLIRQREKSRYIPIIFLTAIDKSDEWMFRGYAVGAVDYLLKPFVPEVLRAKVAVFVEFVQEDSGGTPSSGAAAVANQALQAEIAARQRAEEALRKSEELYRTLAANFPNGAVFLFNQELQYTIADGAGLAPVGLSKEALEGKTIWEAWPPDICAMLDPYYRAALAGTAASFEVSYAHRIYLMHTPDHKRAWRNLCRHGYDAGHHRVQGSGALEGRDDLHRGPRAADPAGQAYAASPSSCWSVNFPRETPAVCVDHSQ